MARDDSVWGIDIGQCALKALKLRNVDGTLRVEAFDIIEHPRILSQPEADRDQLIRNALEQFLARNNLAGSSVVISAPGQSGFTRFVKLPPVEPKQIPEIVRFEAEQQIPFSINEVIWRWQAFTDPDSPDIEVGIFAMKRTDVSDALERFNEVDIAVDAVQMAPLALYNFMEFDEQAGEQGATLLVDVGADKTDLVVTDGPRIWTRTIQLGGNNFTAALVKTFKLSFQKAEKVKRTAATHKYARQIFQSMRPVFAELVQEISRSIGYYTSLHRESRFTRIIGLGNGFRLPGLQKFLEQNLSVPVVRVDSFNKLPASATVNAPAFTENVLSFAGAYGLALQGLGLTKIQTNLLPTEISRQRLWRQKRPWFAAAAALIIAALAGLTWRAYADARTLRTGNNPSLDHARQVVSHYQKWRGDYNKVKGQDQQELKRIEGYDEMLAYRDFWPTVLFVVSDAIGRVARQQGLMNEAGVKTLLATPRPQRQVVEVESLYAAYQADVSGITVESLRAMGGSGAAAPSPRYGQPGTGAPYAPGGRGPYGPGGGAPYAPGAGQPYGTGGGAGVIGTGAGTAGATAAAAGPTQRGYVVTLKGKTPQQGVAATQFLNNIRKVLLDRAKNFPCIEVTLGEFWPEPGRDSRRSESGGRSYDRATAADVDLDPLTKEDMTGDTRFTMMWVFAIREPVSSSKPGGAGPVGTGGAS